MTTERRYKFTLTGVSPLLMHADDVEQSDRLKEWRSDPNNRDISVAGDDRSPPWSWKTYAYSDGNVICVPMDNMMVALRKAGAEITLKRNKTYKEISQSGILPDQMMLPLQIPHNGSWTTIDAAQIEAISGTFREQSDAARDMGFRLFVKRAAVGRAKHVRVRPRFEEWKLDGSFVVTAPELTDEVVRQMFSRAGFYKGLCDWRPGCKTPGTFGRFTAELELV